MFECTKGSYQVCANIEEEKKEFETTCKCGNSITSTTAKEITPTLETIVSSTVSEKTLSSINNDDDDDDDSFTYRTSSSSSMNIDENDFFELLHVYVGKENLSKYLLKCAVYIVLGLVGTIIVGFMIICFFLGKCCNKNKKDIYKPNTIIKNNGSKTVPLSRRIIKKSVFYSAPNTPEIPRNELFTTTGQMITFHTNPISSHDDADSLTSLPPPDNSLSSLPPPPPPLLPSSN